MKSILLLPAILMSTALYAQTTQGTVTYQQTIAIDVKDAGVPEELAGMIPKENKSQKTLYYSPNATLYENAEVAKADNTNEYQQDNVSIRIERRSSEEQTFTDLKNKKRVEQKEIMDRTFLVGSDVAEMKWKFTGRQKKILDMPCMEAHFIEGKDSVTAWYTTAIPVSAGPGIYSGLPGLILEVQEGSNIHLMAIRLDHTAPADKFKAPTKGKKMSPEAFAKLQKEKMEEMQKQYGGKGNVIIMKQGH